jgi:hypothetical protein
MWWQMTFINRNLLLLKKGSKFDHNLILSRARAPSFQNSVVIDKAGVAITKQHVQVMTDQRICRIDDWRS